jgi:hypothetical protein
VSNWVVIIRQARSWWLTCGALVGLALTGPESASSAEVDEAFFERLVRPVLVERCHKCHAGEKSRGGLRLDTRERTLQGGETGPALVAGKPSESLLLQAVEQTGGLKMPPDGRLKDAEIAALRQWIAAGAPWPRTGATEPPDEGAPHLAVPREPALSPDASDLAPALQLWLRADSLSMADGETVAVWPDQSPHGRDVSATKGIRPGGVGGPGRFISQSTLMGRPAVRFETTTGLASSPGNPLSIEGDAALSLVLVMSLQKHEAGSTHDCVLCVGDPANGTDPGRPLAALIEIDRTQEHSLDFAGGFGHDVFPGRGSFAPHYGKSVVLTIVKRPGPTRQTTQIFLNGRLLTNPEGALDGRDEILDLRHRRDVGVFLGKALGFCGPIQGDLGEVLVYSTALTDRQRQGLERHLAEKYGFLWEGVVDLAQQATFTDEERSFWAYQPVRDAVLPEVQRAAWVQTPVDRFVLRALEDRGIQPLPRADRRTLLRRVTLDLTGLPPTPEETQAFLADGSPQAYERVVERLLQSPQYGERWARHWLDLVRYAESTANDANAVMRYAWRYRNYVIDAFNADLPYDQFLIEQLAGDLLPGAATPAEKTRRIIATGYLMVGPKALAETDKEQSRLDIVDDQIDVTGRAMLGLTVACARCHDHKFDAVRTSDYYALAGVFRSTEPFMDENRNATMWWEFDVPQADGQPAVTVMAPRDSAPRNLRVHLRGNRFTLGPVVRRGALQVVSLPEMDASAGIDPQQVSSGRLELARWITHPANPLTPRVMVNRIWQHHFERGLVATSDNFGTRGERPSHPELLDWLAARFVASGWSVKQMHRLIVHSAAYQQQAISENNTPEGDPEGRWFAGHRRRRMSVEEIRDSLLAVTGRLDRRAGTNESGEYLIEKAEGIGAKIRPNRVGADDPFYTTFQKRTIYLPVVRNMLPDVLALFDAADPNGVTAVRNETTVAPQSLFLMNNPLVRDSALALAQQLIALPSGEGSRTGDDLRIHEAHRRVLGRDATDEEVREAREFLAAAQNVAADPAAESAVRRLAAWQSYCQSLLCSNEFLYVE